MKMLTRGEELILLSVWRLGDNAYCVPMREMLNEYTVKKWSFGSIYDALERLEKKGLLESYLTAPEKARGGRSKRIYKHTRAGLQAMLEIKALHERMWEGIGTPAIESKL